VRIGIAPSTISGDSSSDKCLQRALEWLKTCLTDHPLCQLAAKSPLPTRVVQVGSEGKSPFLYESNGENSRYAALSHCWGKNLTKSSPVVTTTANLQDKKHEIKLETLPKSFRDAIVVCRKFGIPYLWIDSLCIIQDSTSDWAAEAGRMSAVYANSLVTIAAVSAEDSTGGCFISRDEDHYEEIHVDCREDRRKAIAIRRLPSLHEYVRGKLQNRGWALQEFALPVRKLLFTSDELGWECYTARHCECGVGEGLFDPYLKAVDLLKRTKTPPNMENAASTNFRTLDNLVEFKWEDVVYNFTQRELTFASDLLPAMSGLATMQAWSTGKTYAAGLWVEDLVTGLLWWPRPYTACKRHASYHAPSWSWASVVGTLIYHDFGEFTSAIPRIQEVKVFPLHSENPLGALSSAYIDLEGFVVPVIIEQSGGKLRATVKRDGQSIPEKDPRHPYLKQISPGKSSLKELIEPLYGHFDLDVVGDGFPSNDANANLAVLTGTYERDGGFVGAALILKGTEDDSWLRIGQMLIYQPSQWNRWLEAAELQKLRLR
jgi:Heterokaryon incompatibility protein (HET)